MRNQNLKMARRSDHTGDEIKELILDATVRIISVAGANALSARKVAGEIGYTAGTIYQHFQNMDDLVEKANIRTLAGMYEACKTVSADLPIEDQLVGLGEAFIRYAEANKPNWDAVITYNYSPGHNWSDAYDQQIENLLGLLFSATKHLYSNAETNAQIDDIRVLWASMFGIFTLDSAGRLGAERNSKDMIQRLAAMFLASREKK